MKNLDNEKQIIDMAISGNQEALETLLLVVQETWYSTCP